MQFGDEISEIGAGGRELLFSVFLDLLISLVPSNLSLVLLPQTARGGAFGFFWGRHNTAKFCH